MSTPTELADSYIAMWNETDAGARRRLIDRIWSENARYVDPVAAGDGRDGIDAMVATIQERFPDHRFHRTGPVDHHNGRLRFTWALAPEGGEPLVAGVDFGTLSADGRRLETITGFFDTVPAAA